MFNIHPSECRVQAAAAVVEVLARLIDADDVCPCCVLDALGLGNRSIEKLEELGDRLRECSGLVRLLKDTQSFSAEVPAS